MNTETINIESAATKFNRALFVLEFGGTIKDSTLEKLEKNYKAESEKSLQRK